MGDLADRVGEVDPVVKELEAALARALRKNAKLKANTEDLIAAVREGAYDATLALGMAPPVKEPALPKAKGKPVEIALVHGTDWQCGKVTSTFSREILDQRIDRLARKVQAITAIQRSEHVVDECVVFFGGDMVEGVSVFPNQSYEVDATLNDQIFHVARTMESLCRELVVAFKKVRVYCVSGNHGRLGRIGDFPEQDNADSLAYRICADRNTEPRIEWNVAESWYHIVEIGNYHALLLHGHEIKGFGGNTPLYGIIRSVSAWGAGVLEPFDAAYLGHFHIYAQVQGFDGRSIYVGSTPESGNQYAARWLKASGEASQRLQFIDPEAGRVNSDHRIFLE